MTRGDATGDRPVFDQASGLRALVADAHIHPVVRDVVNSIGSCPQSFTFRGFHIPARMVESLRAYIDRGVRPCGFLSAVIRNDLLEATARADPENGRNLPAFTAYLVGNAPLACWGSPGKMAAWLKRFDTEGVSA